MVIRKSAVHLTEEFPNLAVQAAKQHRREGAGDAIAAIDHDAEWFAQLDVGNDPVEVVFDDVLSADLCVLTARGLARES